MDYDARRTTVAPDQIEAVRVMVERDGEAATANALLLSKVTIVRILARLPVARLTASHLRMKLGVGGPIAPLVE